MLDLTGYKLTFSDEFNARSISQTGASTTWADIRSEWRFDAHSDIGFGRSSFVDPSSGYDPFRVNGGALSITAVPDTTPAGYPGSWESGLITTQNGFSQTYGYFEMRADLADARGGWDAFWMLPVCPVPNPNNLPGWQELDIVEHYGSYNQGTYRWIHTTDPEPNRNPNEDLQVFSNNPTQVSGYHTYGMSWEADRISFYFDGQFMGSRPTPTDMHGPMYLLANLATQSDAEIGVPMTMKIDYIRAFSKDPYAVAVTQSIVSAPDGQDPGLYGATSAATHPRSDIVWRNDNGAVLVWDHGEIAGAHSIANPGSIPSGWNIVNAGDFAGDQRPDILWQHDNGAVSIWDDSTTAGAHIIAQAGIVPQGWHIAGVGDFDGNSRSDILWRNDYGAVSIWDNGDIAGAHIIAAPGTVPSSWHVAGIANFGGGAQSDILWRNDNGAVSIWTDGNIGNANIISQAGAVPLSWHIAGTGDFAGDGRADILWRNDNGSVSIWDNGQMSGARIVAGANVAGGPIPTSWHIETTGDFDGNGRADILWRNDNGAVSIWDNGTVAGAHIVAEAGAVANGWHVQHPHYDLV